MDLADIVIKFKDQIEALSKLAGNLDQDVEPITETYIDLEELRHLAGVNKSDG